MLAPLFQSRELQSMAKFNEVWREIKVAGALCAPILTGLFIYALVVASAPLTFFAILGVFSLLSLGCAIAWGRDRYKARQKKQLQKTIDTEWPKVGNLDQAEITFNPQPEVASSEVSTVTDSPLIKALLSLRNALGNDKDADHLKENAPKATVTWTASKLEPKSDQSGDRYSLTVKQGNVTTYHTYHRPKPTKN